MTGFKALASVGLSALLIACAGPGRGPPVADAACAAIPDCMAGRAICVLTAARPGSSVAELRASDAHQDMRAQLETLATPERPVRFIEALALADLVSGAPADRRVRTLIFGARGEGIGYVDIFTDDPSDVAAFMRAPASAAVPPGFARVRVAARPGACAPRR